MVRGNRRWVFTVLIAMVVFLFPVACQVHAQSDEMLRAYQDSLVSVESRILATHSQTDQVKKNLEQVREVRQGTDPLRTVAGLRVLVDSLAANRDTMLFFLNSHEKIIEQLSSLNNEVESARDKLAAIDLSKRSSKQKAKMLEKQIAKVSGAYDKLAAPFMRDLWQELDDLIQRYEITIRDLHRRETLLKMQYEGLLKKIEMEKLYLRAVQSFLSSLRGTSTQLCSSYAQLVEASQQDQFHNYDSLFTLARQAADTMLAGGLLALHKNAGVIIPGGQCVLSDGREYQSGSIVVSTVPIMTSELQLLQIAKGERSPQFAQALKGSVDKPVENASIGELSELMIRFGGRLLTSEEEEYVNASGFASVSEKERYGVVYNLYGFSPDPRYRYICWAEGLESPEIKNRLEAIGDKIDKERSRIKCEAWQYGLVQNPKRLLASIWISGGAVFNSRFQYDKEISAEFSLLFGYRYAIEGTERSGERYGFVGLRYSYQSFARAVQDMFGHASFSAHDISLLFTLGRALYIGVGLYQRYSGSYKLERLYSFPVGLLLRLGTNSALNIGGKIFLPESLSFDQASYEAALGLTIDVPIIRFMH
ncbi:MAG: hypothetical protein ACP5JH_02355 [Bacteroidota bacterium]